MLKCTKGDKIKYNKLKKKINIEIVKNTDNAKMYLNKKKQKSQMVAIFKRC